MCFVCLREKRYVFDDLFTKDLLDQGFCVDAFLRKNFLIANAAVIYFYVLWFFREKRYMYLIIYSQKISLITCEHMFSSMGHTFMMIA